LYNILDNGGFHRNKQDRPSAFQRIAALLRDSAYIGIGCFVIIFSFLLHYQTDQLVFASAEVSGLQLKDSKHWNNHPAFIDNKL